MNKTILLTSFRPWLAHHRSNASDDLLAQLQQAFPSREINGFRWDWLRHLPVDGEIASAMTIERIDLIQPQIVICCGMAERYQYLTVEHRATCGETCLTTNLDLDRVLRGLNCTKIGYDAGKFVCESLYFSVLNYLPTRAFASSCLFLHVPVLTDRNSQPILSDFFRMLNNLTIM
jgi:pyroglutamyl-peptidase